ncbi:MAG: hypothetical protein ACLR0N_15185 [Bilophila wadsworthia]
MQPQSGRSESRLLAGSLDMTGTTLALAIRSLRGEPIVLVASLGSKCSALGEEGRRQECRGSGRQKNRLCTRYNA